MKKGFTLIELLAVIVVLAIIVSITVPIIMNVIDEAKLSTTVTSATGLADSASLLYGRRIIDDSSYFGETITFTDSLCSSNELSFSGEGPISGSIVIDSKGKVLLENLKFRDYICNGYRNEITCSKIIVYSAYEPGDDIYFDPVDNSNCDAAKYNSDNSGTCYKWYALTASDTDDNMITLIMNENLGANVEWYAAQQTNTIGPKTVLQTLNERTANWVNVPVISSYSYTNSGKSGTRGYTGVHIINGTTTLISNDGISTNNVPGETRARLITLEEYNALKASNDNVTPEWLYENIGFDLVPYGYWMLTSNSSVANIAYLVYYNISKLFDNVNADNGFGPRPIITIPKSSL